MLETASFILHLISVPIIAVSATGLIILYRRIGEIRQKQRAELFPEGLQSAGFSVESSSNPQWERIQEFINSTNPNDWKAAIIEADMILDDLLTRMGYAGESVGEKLKQVEPSDFLTLDRAWAAHKIRNSIAHEADFTIDHRKAQQAVEDYRSVFEEFQFI